MNWQIYLSSFSHSSSICSCQLSGGASSQALKYRTIPGCSSFANALTSRITFSRANSLELQKKKVMQLTWRKRSRNSFETLTTWHGISVYERERTALHTTILQCLLPYQGRTGAFQQSLLPTSKGNSTYTRDLHFIRTHHKQTSFQVGILQLISKGIYYFETGGSLVFFVFKKLPVNCRSFPPPIHSCH